MRSWLWLLLCLGLIACGKHETQEPRFVGTDISGAQFGNPLALTDHQGNPRKLADFQGKVVALFFGYTHCPDVCPTTLDDMAKAQRLLGYSPKISFEEGIQRFYSWYADHVLKAG